LGARVGKTCFELTTSLVQNDRSAFIETDDVKRVLLNIDAHRGNGQGLLHMAELLSSHHPSVALLVG
jgi:hypothetical protein